MTAESEREKIIDHYERRLRSWAEVCTEFHDRIELNERFFSRSAEQWPAEDRARNEQREQPSLAINQIMPVVNLLTGREMTSRLQPKPFPKALEITDFAEICEEAMRTLRDDAEAEHEDSMGFRPQVAHGYGWVRHFWDEADEDGVHYSHASVPVYQMVWDPFKRKGNLIDRDGQMHGAWIGVDDLADDFGMTEDSIAKIKDSSSAVAGGSSGHWAWSQVLDGYHYSPEEERVFVVRYEWKERVPIYEVATVNLEQARMLVQQYEAGGVEEEAFRAALAALTADEAMAPQTMEAEAFRMYKSEYSEIFGNDPPTTDYARGRRWKYRFAYIAGPEVLEWGDIPVGRFTYECVTGIPIVERNLTTYVGIVDLMRDGQEWRNRMLLLALMMAAAAVKNGIIIERGQNIDLEEVEDKMARPGFVLGVPPGFFSQTRMQVVSTQMSIGQALQSLLDYAEEAALSPTGLNKAALGQIHDPRRVTGTVVSALQQAANLALAQFVDAQRRFRRRSGTLTLAYILRYHDEGSIQALVGRGYLVKQVTDPMTGQVQEVPKELPPKAAWPMLAKFRMTVEESPSGPTASVEMWEALFQHGIVNTAYERGDITWEDILDMTPSSMISSDLRDMLKERWKARMMQQQMAQQQAPPVAAEGG